MERLIFRPRRCSALDQLLDSNARRLDTLHNRGVDVIVNGPALLQFVFDRVLATGPRADHRLNWARNVASLLDDVESCDAMAMR
jgi:hypothetical protein